VQVLEDLPANQIHEIEEP